MPSSCRAVFAVMIALLGAMLAVPACLPAQFFPFYDRATAFSGDAPTSEVMALAPLYYERHTTATIQVAVRPFYARERDVESGDLAVWVLWPLYSYRYQAQVRDVTDLRRVYAGLLYYNKTEHRAGREERVNLLVPLWYSGDQEGHGRYRILFPFFWYGQNARLAVPLFPPRDQTFAALWPLIGDFRGYWNRDRIFFLLWPLFVHSSHGTPGDEDYNRTDSVIWPFFARVSGPTTSGWRVWPLFSRVEKQGEFTRGYYLWPLGHFRSGRISRTNADQQEVSLFIPFYGRIRRPKLSFDMLFPFYGKLEMKGRRTEGYAAGLYNREFNLRRGTREDRWLWFIIRRKTAIDIPPELAANQDEPPSRSLGGGVFPFYVRYHNDKRDYRSIVWPFGHYRLNHYAKYDFERTYVLPVYVNKHWRYNDGTEKRLRYCFPFVRQRLARDGERRSNTLHLFFYGWFAPIDQLYAPLWTLYESEDSAKTGDRRVRAAWGAWQLDRRGDGAVRRRLNLGLVQHEFVREPGQPTRSSTRLLFGLVGRHHTPDLKTEVLGRKF